MNTPKRSIKGMQFLGVGFELIILALGALYIGKEIDKQYNTKGIATIVLLFIGLCSWTFHLIVLLKAFNRNEAKEREREKK